ncbi:MAG: peptide ABC transporter permease [Dermacoccus nishinomiyaensis]|uniref:ABC transporter permease n=1 Tax=Dermacoccus nishinomiyaensis TaxID=1274 RepID=UPI000DB51FF4|nr:ABC transporter permease [Dermacoccus nishinomiyaensis]PZP03473.1 MAG: peptide ABC transporter permease [Dermacoccus nishinomiyaensis]
MVTGDPALEGMGPDGAEPQTPEEPKAIEGRSLRQIAVSRLKRDKATLAAMTVAGLFVLTAILAPILVKLKILDPLTNHQDLINADSSPKGSWGGMSAEHWLGVVPGSGTDTLSRLLYGITFSVVVGLCATLVAVIIGLVVGLASGFAGGKVDFLGTRLIDLVLCFPQTLMLLALSGTFIARIKSMGVSDDNVAAGIYVILVLGLFGWPTFARIIRGQVMTLRNREFVEAARSLGATNKRVYFTELLPNLWAPILVYATLLFPAFVSAEAALSYLTVGIKAPTPTLGNIITDSVNYLNQDPLYFFAPVFTIAALVLSFNLVGDGLRDALDPRADRH